LLIVSTIVLIPVALVNFSTLSPKPFDFINYGVQAF
jgi:hypothetical protein